MLGFTNTSIIMTTKDFCTLPRGVQGPRLGARPGERVQLWVQCGQAFAHVVQSRSAWKADKGPSLCGPTTHTWRAAGVHCYMDGVAVKGWAWRSDSRSWSCLLVHGTLHLWWGRNLSSCKRLRDIGWISLILFHAQFGFWNQFSWEVLWLLSLRESSQDRGREQEWAY